MKAIHKEAVLEDDGVLIIHDLPLKKGQKVDVHINSLKKHSKIKKYPLRGLSYRLNQPFKSIAEQDWDVFQ